MYLFRLGTLLHVDQGVVMVQNCCIITVVQYHTNHAQNEGWVKEGS